MQAKITFEEDLMLVEIYDETGTVSFGAYDLGFTQIDLGDGVKQIELHSNDLVEFVFEEHVKIL